MELKFKNSNSQKRSIPFQLSKYPWIPFLSLLVAGLIGQKALAVELYPGLEDESLVGSQVESQGQISKEYYTIDESAYKNPKMMDPLTLAQQVIDNSLEALEVQAKSFNLLDWRHHSEDQEAPAEPYNRKGQFGRWINDPTDQTCFNTRAKVLIRDSKVPVQFKSYNKCIVQSGQWDDPYSNRQFTESRDIQIDHMVPLKNAYISGAHRWKPNKKCLYANFMANNHHLVSAGARENMSKGDRTPAGYMPTNPTFQCQYIVNWLKIKLSWQLEMTPDEAYAIRLIVGKEGCDPKMFEMQFSEVQADRDAQSIAPEVCRKEL